MLNKSRTTCIHDFRLSYVHVQS